LDKKTLVGGDEGGGGGVNIQGNRWAVFLDTWKEPCEKKKLLRGALKGGLSPKRKKKNKGATGPGAGQRGEEVKKNLFKNN